MVQKRRLFFTLDKMSARGSVSEGAERRLLNEGLSSPMDPLAGEVSPIDELSAGDEAMVVFSMESKFPVRGLSGSAVTSATGNFSTNQIRVIISAFIVG